MASRSSVLIWMVMPQFSNGLVEVVAAVEMPPAWAALESALFDRLQNSTRTSPDLNIYRRDTSHYRI